MSGDSSVELQQLIDRFTSDNESARRELLNRAIDRLRRLAGKMLNESFPRLRDRHDVDSVVHETWMRLVQALEQTDPPTVQDFFRLAALKIRQVLLDLIAQQKRSNWESFRDVAGTESSADYDPSQDTLNPSRLSAWTEFHERVATLADDERSVFEMHYYMEVPQAQIAGLLNLPPRQISRLWIKATRRLADGLDVSEGVL